MNNTAEQLAKLIMDADRRKHMLEENEDLRGALTKLANEVRGCLSAYEHELRYAMGNTNFAVLELREQEARSVLGEPR